MFCHKCGHELPENSKFCPKCGVLLDFAKQPTTSAPEPPKTQHTPTPGTRSRGPTYIIKDEKYKAITKFAIASCVISILSTVVLCILYGDGIWEEIHYDIVMNRWSHHIKFMTYALILEAISILIPYFIAIKDMSIYIGADTGIIIKTILTRVFFPWRRPQITGSFEENYANDYMKSKYQYWFATLPFPIIYVAILCIFMHCVS